MREKEKDVDGDRNRMADGREKRKRKIKENHKEIRRKNQVSQEEGRDGIRKNA